MTEKVIPRERGEMGRRKETHSNDWGSAPFRRGESADKMEIAQKGHKLDHMVTTIRFSAFK